MKHLKFVAFLAYRVFIELLTLLTLPLWVVLGLVAGATLALTEWVIDVYHEFNTRSKKGGDS